MNVTITWHNDQFNVELSSKEGADAFLSIKGARIVDGKNGPFVSWPATKNNNTGKYWSHVWGSDKFNAVVLAKAQESMPRKTGGAKAPRDEDSDIPFVSASPQYDTQRKARRMARYDY